MCMHHHVPACPPHPSTYPQQPGFHLQVWCFTRVFCCCACAPTCPLGHQVLRQSHSHHQRGHTDAALTWEVPLALDKQFGPSLQAVLDTDPAPANTPGSASSSHAAAGGPTSSSSSRGSSPPAAAAVPPLAGGRQQHPLVLLYRQEFAAAGQAHLQRLVRQLLAAEEVGQAEVWEGVLVRLASQAATTILPAAAAAHGEQDPRYYVKVGDILDGRVWLMPRSNVAVRQLAGAAAQQLGGGCLWGMCSIQHRTCLHLSCQAKFSGWQGPCLKHAPSNWFLLLLSGAWLPQVKRLPDIGAPGASCVVAGVVAKKNVANRKMRTSIDSARVLLLAGALEYQRVNHKLSSFDTLLEQVWVWGGGDGEEGGL